MKNSLAIFGCSGHGKVIADISEKNGFEPVFFDDKFTEIAKSGKWKIIGNFQDLVLSIKKYTNVFVGIGDNHLRAEKQLELEHYGFKFPVLIDPSAQISGYSTIQNGTVVMPNSVVNIHSTIGKGAIINSGSIIEHDCKIDDFSHISPNATLAGNVHIKEKTWIGAGTTIKQKITVGKNSIIGAGSIVLEDLPNNVLAYGVPAKTIKNVKY